MFALAFTGSYFLKNLVDVSRIAFVFVNECLILIFLGLWISLITFFLKILYSFSFPSDFYRSLHSIASSISGDIH